jgi:hypothetical protein
MKNDLILNPHGCPNGLETMSENLMLWFGSLDQVAPPSVEENDRPKIGASFGGPFGGPPSSPTNGGCPLTPGNGVVVGTGKNWGLRRFIQLRIDGKILHAGIPPAKCVWNFR